MLVLARKEQQQIIINDKISLTILEIHKNGVRIGVQAPNDVSIVRTELLRGSLSKPHSDNAGS